MALNQAAFEAAQKRTEEAGRRGDMANAQISPWEWQKLGGNINQYEQLYGPNAFYDKSGNVTNLGQQHNLQPAQNVDDNRVRAPGTNIPISGGTGVWMDPNTGQPIQPGADMSSPEGAANSSMDAARWYAQFAAGQNRVNEENPYGSSQYVQDPQTGQWTRKTELSNWQQRLLEQQQGQDYETGNAAGSMLGQFTGQGPFSYKGIAEIPGEGDLIGERKRVEDNLYNTYVARMEPQFQQEQQAFQQQMADQGISPGSAKYNQQYQQMMQSQNDAKQQASAQASQQGLAEYQGMFGAGLQKRQQDVGEYGTQYAAPLNAMTTLQNAQRGITNPQYQAIPTTDIPYTDPASIWGTYYSGQVSKDVAEIGADATRDAAETAAEASMYNSDNASDQTEGYASGDTELSKTLQTQQKAKTLKTPTTTNPKAAGYGGVTRDYQIQ